MIIQLNGKTIRLNPRRLIGQGGEAEVYDIGKNRVVKVFKPPSHPDYQACSQAQTQAEQRLKTHQQKLPSFPQILPDRVIAPLDLAYDDRQQIIGYTMPKLNQVEPLLKYGDRNFRQGITHQQVVRVFQNLHDTVSKLHFARIVIGDFNDLNILIRDDQAYLIDADSFQFDSFLCSMFTAKFVDPSLCDRQANQPILIKPHSEQSDWYAFAVMLFQSLLFVDPFGGLYKPKDPSRKVPQAARSLHGITVFHPDVKYPKPALPYRYLPDALLHEFQQIFAGDRRGEFPRPLLDNLHWQTCTTCGADHARPTCPDCTQTQPGQVVSVTVVRGSITATTVFKTQGNVVTATIQTGQVKAIYWEHGQFRREDGALIVAGERHPHQRWQIQGDRTWLGQGEQVLVFQAGQVVERLAVDSAGAIAQFHVQADQPAHTPGSVHWLQQGSIHRWGKLGAEFVGTVLHDRTQVWLGSHFGFGLYRAGYLTTGFVFERDRGGLNDQVQLPRWLGEVIGLSCSLGPDYAWIWALTQHQGQRVRHCCVVQRHGQVMASAQATIADADHWLMQLDETAFSRTPSPFCAVGNFLLAATDTGIHRIDIAAGQIAQTRTFPDTEPFVDGQTQLLPAPDGLYAVRSRQIIHLKLT